MTLTEHVRELTHDQVDHRLGGGWGAPGGLEKVIEVEKYFGRHTHICMMSRVILSVVCNNTLM